jgi:hypothetical protein
MGRFILKEKSWEGIFFSTFIGVRYTGINLFETCDNGVIDNI